MNKITMIALCAILSFVGIANAVVITNQGQVIEVTILTEVAEAVHATNVWIDTSDYPAKVGEPGTIIRKFNSHVDSIDITAGVASSIDLAGNYLGKTNGIPDGFVIDGGFIQVIEAFPDTPITNMYLGVNSAADLFGAAAGTNILNATGVYALDAASWATRVVTTNTRPIKFTVESTNSTFSSGSFILVLTGYQAVPGQ